MAKTTIKTASKSVNRSRHDRGTDWTKMPNARLHSILNDPFTRGSDGLDYAPYREELEIELWRRQARDADELLKQYERDQRDYQKHIATTHKRKAS